jgi:hypothetical protein
MAKTHKEATFSVLILNWTRETEKERIIKTSCHSTSVSDFNSLKPGEQESTVAKSLKSMDHSHKPLPAKVHSTS